MERQCTMSNGAGFDETLFKTRSSKYGIAHIKLIFVK